MARKEVLLVLVLFAVHVSAGFLPVVLMHGITASTSTLSHVVEMLQLHLPGVYVKNIEIGDGPIDSVFWSMEHQLDVFCSEVASDPKLAGGINLMGFSQGGMITRGYIERCNNPPVVNYISWVAPQMGVFGVPKVGHVKYLNWTLDEIADCCAYDDWAQDIFSFFGYWRDPFALSDYVQNCRYLPDLNNERTQKNDAYKKNILSLKNFLMGMSSADETLIPRETGWFGTYAANSTTQIVPLEQQPFYINDWIGLKELNDSGRLNRFKTNCSHGDYFSACFDQYFLQYVLPVLQQQV